jgi:hypothetical protein
MNVIMASCIHDDARRLRFASALLATAERAAVGRPADASPMSSEMKRTIRTVGSISWFPSLFHCLRPPNREAKAKFHARGTVRRMNAVIMSRVHNEAIRLRVAAAFLNAAERSAANAAAFLRWRMGFRLTAAGTAFLSAATFLIHKLSAQLLSRARHAI